MQKIEFGEALDAIIATDPRFHREAYLFIKDALDFTQKARRKNKEDTGVQHVSGQELLEGIRQFAIKEYGPMVPTLFDFWGIRCCEDFGTIVFNLINAGVLRQADGDSVEDFKGGYGFEDAFVAPFRPTLPGAANSEQNSGKKVGR